MQYFKDKPLSQIPIEKIKPRVCVKNSLGREARITSVQFDTKIIRVDWVDGGWMETDQKDFDDIFVYNKYEGQSLSNVPYEDIFIGMEVISAIGNPGWILRKTSAKDAPNRENDNWLMVKWSNKNTSANLHMFFNAVTVK